MAGSRHTLVEDGRVQVEGKHQVGREAVDHPEIVQGLVAAEAVQFHFQALLGRFMEKVMGGNETAGSGMDAPAEAFQPHDGAPFERDNGLEMGFDPFPVDDFTQVENSRLGALSQCAFIHWRSPSKPTTPLLYREIK